MAGFSASRTTAITPVPARTAPATNSTSRAPPSPSTWKPEAVATASTPAVEVAWMMDERVGASISPDACSPVSTTAVNWTGADTASRRAATSMRTPDASPVAMREGSTTTAMSCAPESAASRASAAFTNTWERPAGKPATVPIRGARPSGETSRICSSNATTDATAAGCTRTPATPSTANSSARSATCAVGISGSSRATSRRLRGSELMASGKPVSGFMSTTLTAGLNSWE